MNMSKNLTLITSIEFSNGRKLLEEGCFFEEHGWFDKAYQSYRAAAAQGSPEACLNLGNLYDSGRGCDKSTKLSIYWYKIAAKRGCSSGAYNLGVHYRSLKNIRWSVFWFTRAIEMGDEDAARELNTLC